MIVSDQAKLLFLHIPRTGGTSIMSLLKDRLPDAKGLLLQHDNASTVSISFFRQYSDYFKFSFVRNPWDRLLSLYALALKYPVDNSKPLFSFEAFYKKYELEQVNLKLGRAFYLNQTDYLYNKNGEMVVDKVGRYENYEHELLEILHEQNIPFTYIPRLNKTEHAHYRSFYSEERKKFVEKLCYKDIESFGYRF